MLNDEVQEEEFGEPEFDKPEIQVPSPPPKRHRRQPRPKTPDIRMSAEYAAALTMALNILSARLLALLALLGGIMIFGYAAFEPDRWLVAVSYAVGVLIPAMALSYLKG